MKSPRSIMQSVHHGMKQRCFNSKNKRYHRYGGRGITVCERWQIFDYFYADLPPRPEGKSLDRKNNDGPYSCGRCEQCIANGWPKNVRWATPRQQGQNQSTNVRLTYKGKTRIAAEWSRITGIPQGLIVERIKHGWSIGEALTWPPQPKPSNSVMHFRLLKRRRAERDRLRAASSRVDKVA